MILNKKAKRQNVYKCGDEQNKIMDNLMEKSNEKIDILKKTTYLHR